MATLLLTGLLALTTSSSMARATPAAITLEQGIKRETALLLAEQQALQTEVARIEASRARKVATLQAAIAVLEGELVDAAAREATLRATLGATGQPPSVTAANTATAVEQVRETFALLGPAPTTTTVEPRVEPIVELLPVAVERLALAAGPRTIETGFFDDTGTWVKGHVLQLGAAVAVAAADGNGPAGALLPARDGARQLALGDARSAAAARALVAGEASSLIPLALSADVEADEGHSVVVAGFIERLGRLGPGAFALMAAVLMALLVGVLLLARTVVAGRSVDAVAGRLTALMSAGEVVAATALARTVVGAPGVFLRAVVAAAGRPGPEDEVAALAAEVGFALDRVVHGVRLAGILAGAVVVFVSAHALSGAVEGLLGSADVKPRAVLDALAGALLPLEVGALAAIPLALLLAASVIVVAHLKERLETLALRILDAAARART
jgi:hypothetical protein